ncbi:MAG: TIGR02281 family clan AA aspartic protease [bacterium]
MTRLLKLLPLIIVLTLGGFSPSIWAEDKIQLVMTGTNRAIVLFNDERLVLSPGDNTHPRVALIEANSGRAIISVDGKPMELDPSSVAAPVLDDGESSNVDDDDGGVVTLWADSSGFFFARGKVNRRSIRFLVDTGADSVTFSSAQADRLGLDYKNAKDGFASTASGVAPLKSITLDRLSIEGISLRNVSANVILGSFPEFPLLGGSFLNKLNMVRSGKKMELSRR